MSLWQTLKAIHKEDNGLLITEYALVTAAIVVPFGLLAGPAVFMIKAYYYRGVGTICLPFP